jgi:hypothetical protein
MVGSQSVPWGAACIASIAVGCWVVHVKESPSGVVDPVVRVHRVSGVVGALFHCTRKVVGVGSVIGCLCGQVGSW